MVYMYMNHDRHCTDVVYSRDREGSVHLRGLRQRELKFLNASARLLALTGDWRVFLLITLKFGRESDRSCFLAAFKSWPSISKR